MVIPTIAHADTKACDAPGIAQVQSPDEIAATWSRVRCAYLDAVAPWFDGLDTAWMGMYGEDQQKSYDDFNGFMVTMDELIMLILW